MDEPAFNLKDARVCIIGLGLMGGSLAMALKDQVVEISAVDVNPKSRNQAMAWGIVERVSDDLKLAADANLVMLATPVRTLIVQIRELAGILRLGTTVIDLGSVKAPVVAAMNALPESIGAVAGHPMCGKEVSGLEYADAALFHRARFVLCRTERTTPEAWKIAGKLVEVVGAQRIEMDAVQHDRVAAGTSHLPYLLSAALALTTGMQAAHDEGVWMLASSGFRDTSRLAGSDPAMMRDILLSNREEVLDRISEAESHLNEIAILIEKNDGDALLRLLCEAQNFRHEWEEKH
jgi:prephenate dehydrogenase